MNEAYRSNQKSVLQHILKERDVNPYTYDYNNNFSDGVKTCHFVYPEVREYTYGDIVHFDVPTFGNLAKAFIEITFTLNGAFANGIDRPAEKFFEWIELRTKKGELVLQHLSDTYTMLRTDLLEQGTFTRMSVLLNPILVSGTTYRMYVPLYAFFSEHPSKFVKTELTEPLMVYAKINSSKDVIGIEQDITDMDFRLHLTYFKADLGSVDALPLTYVISHEFREPIETEFTTGDSSYSGVFKCDRSVFATHFILENGTADLKSIKSVKIKLNGKTLYESNFQLNAMELGWIGSSGFQLDISPPSENLGQRFFTIYWSMYPDRTRNTLAINFKDCKPVEYEITFDELVDDDEPPYYLKIVHEYFDLINLDSDGNYIVENLS